MNKLHNIFNEYIKDSEKRKKYTAFLLALSMLVMFFVPLGLTEDAYSMTLGSPGGAILTQQLRNDVDNNKLVSGAINLSTKGDRDTSLDPGQHEYFQIGAFDKEEDIGETGSYDVNGDSIELRIGIDYEVHGLKNTFNTSATGAHFYVPLDEVVHISSEDEDAYVLIRGNVSNQPILDTANGFDDADSNPAGHFSIGEDGCLYITLTNAYIDHLNKSDGNAMGSLSFFGTLSATGNQDDSCKIIVGGEEIEVNFTLPETKPPTLQKGNDVVNGQLKKNEAGEDVIEWTITLTNDSKYDLTDYYVIDEMLAKAESVTITPGGAGIHNNNKVTFNDSSKNAETITITYTTKLNNILGDFQKDANNNIIYNSLTNTVKLYDKEDKEKGNASSQININKPNLIKEGKPDYLNGRERNNEIDWTITVNNNGGLNLGGYTIVDNKFPNDISEFEITDNSGNTINATVAGGVLTLPDGIGTPQSITIKYTTTNATANNNQNTATLKKGNVVIDTESKNPEYKDVDAMYSIDKSGQYNADTGKITWTVIVEATEDNVSLTGYMLKDDAFRNASDFTLVEFYSSTNKGWNMVGNIQEADRDKYYVINGDTLTFKKNGDTEPGKVKFTYTTDATPGNAPTTQTNAIALENPKTTVKTTVASVEVPEARHDFTKNVQNNSVDIGKTNGEKEVTLHWTVVLISDDGFAGKHFDDIFSAKQGDKNLDSKIENVKVYPRDNQNGGNKSEITSGYTLNGASIAFGSNFQTPNNEHYVVIEYDTVVTLPAVSTGDYNGYNSIKYDVTNEGSGDFGDGPGTVKVTINRTNPNLNDTSLTVGKHWDNGVPANVDKIYVYLTAKGNDGKDYYVTYGSDKVSYKLIEQSAVNDANWVEASANGSGILFMVSKGDSNNEWQRTFSTLPTSREINGNVIEYYNYVVHEYSIGTTTGNKFGDNRYVELSDKSIVEKNEYNNTQIKNTYYPNLTKLKVKKNWSGDNGTGSNVDYITVKIERSGNNGWELYKDNVQISDFTNGQEITGDFPGAEIDQYGNLVTYDYRVVEKSITINGTTIVSKPSSDYSKLIFVDNDGNYYDTSTNQSFNASGEAEIGNEYHKAGDIEIEAQKQWGYKVSEYDVRYYNSLEELRDQHSGAEDHLKSILVKLQRRVKGTGGDAGWGDVADSTQTITATDSNPVKWNVRNQEVVDGKLVIYEYRVVECGFVTDYHDTWDTTTTGDRTIYISDGSETIAASPEDGSYTISYENNRLTSNGTAKINNIYTPNKTSITPQKTWSYDNSDQTAYNKSEFRANSVIFVLQQKNSRDHEKEWFDYEVNGTPVTVTFTKSENEADNQANTTWAKYDISPEGFDLNNLPREWMDKEIIKDAAGKDITTYISKKYTYRFVEKSVNVNENDYDLIYDDIYAENLTGATPQIDFSSEEQGKYVSSINGGVVDNRLKPNKGIEKYSVNSKANKIESIDIEDLEQYKYTLSDGKEYYIFNYVIEYTKSEMKAVIDTLPEGFTLVEEVFHKDGTGAYWANGDKDIGGVLTLEAGMNQNHPAWSDSTLQGSLGEAIGEGYYAAPLNFIIAPFEQNKKKAEWTGYFQGVKESQYWDSETNSMKSEYLPYEIDEVFQQYSNKYRYEKDNRKLYIANVNLSNDDAKAYYGYSIKIEKDELEKKLANGTFSIENTADKREYNGDKTGLSSTNTLVIKKPDNLINKDFAETIIPGYVTYTIDVNPDAKTLSNGSTVKITDIFDTKSYTLRDECSNHKKTGGHAESFFEGSKLVDVLLNSLDVYAYDSNGNKMLLDQSQYTFVFKNGADAEEGTATLELNVPDATHISIEYTYKLIANENTPSVMYGCRSSERVNGKYPIMASGMVPPAGDKIAMTNTARLETESNSAEKTKEVAEYEITESSGIITTKKLPKIRKVNVADYTIDDLDADFFLAKYDKDDTNNEGWIYATGIQGKEVDWGGVVTQIPEDAATIELRGKTTCELNLEEGVLYKLLEVKIPDGYEGSNLKKLRINSDGTTTLEDFTAADYKKLIMTYFNTMVDDNTLPKTTYKPEGDYEEVDYSYFLTTFVFVHYFVYNALPSNILRPLDLNTADVMQIQTGGSVDVPNNELIDIKGQKDWVNFDENAGDIENTSIILQLYWSDLNEASIPQNAKPVEADELGIVNYEGHDKFSSVIEVPYGTDTKTLWTQLPNGNGLIPIYYYVKEIGYRIGNSSNTEFDGTLYMLDEASSSYKEATNYVEEINNNGDVEIKVDWVEDSTKVGQYLPTYVNNAVNSNVSNDDSVKITNSNTLRLHKVWTDADNNILPVNSSKIDTESITVDIYGIDANGVRSASAILEGIELTRNSNWYADITNEQLGDADLSTYVSFEAVESGLPTLEDGAAFVTSVTFKINNNTGEITVINKNPNAVTASVSVNKTWSDGNDIHKSDSVEVTLYQVDASKEAALGTSPSVSALNAAGATIYQLATTTSADDETSETTETIPYNPVTLNAENDWSNVWSGLPLDNADEQANGVATVNYVYYVVEGTVNATNADKYTSKVELEKKGSNYAYTISNERPSITVKKEWYDKNGNSLLQYDEDGNIVKDDSPTDTIEVRLYKEGNKVPTTAVNIYAIGDSITDGYGNLSKGSQCYPSVLTGLLTSGNGFNLNLTSDIHNEGRSSHKISEFQTNASGADIILLLGGTNDVHQGSGIRSNDKSTVKNAIKTAMNAEIASLRTSSGKNPVIFLGTIPYFNYYNVDAGGTTGTVTQGGSWWWNAGNFGVYGENSYDLNGLKSWETECNDIIDYANEAIEEIAAGDDEIILVDINSAVTPKTTQPDGTVVIDTSLIREDGCHPNASGYQAIANAYYNAIANSYTPKEYLKSNGEFTDNVNEAATFEITADGNWAKVIDLPSGFDKDTKLSVEEVGVGEGDLKNWTVSYDNNSQTALSSDAIIVKNTNTPPETTIEIIKTWKNDAEDTSGRDNLLFKILRSTDQENWEEIEADRDETFGENGIEKGDTTWKLKFKNLLPAEAPNGDKYFYKIEEEKLEGYSCSIPQGEINGIEAVKDQTLTFHAENTRSMSITVKKDWSDINTKDHMGDTVKVKLWRSTTAPTDFSELPLSLKVKPSGLITMGVDSTMTLEANREATFESDNPDIVTVDSTGKITAIAEGTAKITVTADKETVEIPVKVVALAIEAPGLMTAGDSAKATVKYSGSEVTSGLTFKSDKPDIVSVDNNGNIEAKDVGEAKITVTYNGISISKDISVVYTGDFELKDANGITGTNDTPIEVALGESIVLTPDPDYGEFDFAITSGDGATITKDGKSVTVTAGTVADKTVTITATRKSDGKTATCVIKTINSNIFKDSISNITADTDGSKTLYFNDEHTDVEIDSIVIENININVGNATDIKFACESDASWDYYGRGRFTVYNYGTLGFNGNDDGDHFTVTLVGNTLTINNFTDKANYIYFSNSNLSGDYTITLKSKAKSANASADSYSLKRNSVSILADAPADNSTWVSVGDKEYYEFEIKNSDNWEKTISNLEVGKNGSCYYYWIEEDLTESKLGNYTASYNYNDEFNTHYISNKDATATIKNTPNADYEGVEMPSTGGSGTAPYRTVGMIIAGGAVIAFTIRRRRRKSA